MFEIKLITGKTGNLLSLFNKYKCNENMKYASGEVKWRCNNKNCSAFIKTLDKERNTTYD